MSCIFSPKQFEIASTIYNLNYQKTLDIKNYEFITDYTLDKVNKIIFIDERKDFIFCNTTGKELFKFFF